jgi:hypothetical protein
MRHALAAVVLIVLTACATVDPDFAVRRENVPGQAKRELVKLTELSTKDPNLTDLRDAAILSAAIYRPEEALPATPEWTAVAVRQAPPLDDKLETPALTYGLWVNTNRKPATALLVFRGTAIAADWYSNLRWVTLLIPRVEDLYEKTTRITPQIVQDIRAQYGADTQIITAGHSLGGGLAQTAAYAACGDIAIVFAFDPSPVTHHTVRNTCTDQPQYFYRVYERNEALSWVRFGVRKLLGLSPADPHMTELKVRLFPGIGIRAHSMTNLAIGLDAKLR